MTCHLCQRYADQRDTAMHREMGAAEREREAVSRLAMALDAEFQSVGPNAALFARMTEADKKCIQGAMFLAFTQGWIDRDTLHRVGVDAEGSPGRDK